MVEYKKASFWKTEKTADQSGFTLIEVMVAMVVLVIGVMGVLYMQLATVKGNANSIGISQAVHQLSAGLDMLEALDFDDPGTHPLDAGTGKTVADLFDGANDSGITDNMTGTLTYDVADLSAADLKTAFGYTDAFPKAKGKRVTVYFTQNISGASKTVQLQYMKIDI